MSEREKESVISSVRATLLSVKGAITIQQCNRDYRELTGGWIPFKKLGYPSLENFFLENPGFRTTQRNGEWYVDAIANEESKHIVDMVSRQKSSKKSVKLVHPNRFPKRQGSWRNAEPSTSYASNYNNQYYRANKGGTPFNNNYNNYSRYSNHNANYNNKYTNKTETKSTNYTGKPYEKKTTTIYPGTKTTVYPGAGKPEPKASETDKTASSRSYNGTSQASREVNTLTEEFKHSMRTEPEVKPSGKISASQRMLNLRDRLNTVDVIPLQMPAANNESMYSCASASAEEEPARDPVAHAAPALKLEPPPECTSAVAKLAWTCRKLGLPPPVYKVHDTRPKRGPVCYDCTCKVGTQYSASSYPDSSPSEELAKEVVAVKLISVIESHEAGGLPTSGSGVAMSCLAELVADHEAGLWANDVPHLYRQKYGENLPSNWQELVENCDKIITDRVVNGLLVLLPNNEEAPAPAASPFLDSTLMDGTIDSDLPPLQFPKEDFWNVFITVAPSPIEIWLRIIGDEYSDVFEALLAEMSSYYERSGTLVDKAMLIIGAWYAVKLEDGGWQRAKILEIEGDIVNVFLGDHGDDDTVSVERIKILEPRFRQLPAQAILCRLENAEELACSGAARALVRRRLPGEALVAAPGPRADPADPSVALTLYDTSTQLDLNLNKEIIHDFCIAGAFTLTQKPVEVEVGCVTDEGRVWVSRGGGAALVAAALAVLTAPDSPYRRPLPPAPPAPPAAAALYIVRTLDGEWVRCTIISGLDGEGTVRTQLVDSGLILRAPLSSLVPLQNFSPALNAYPYQAMQVRLGSAERAASGMVSRLRELLIGAHVLCRALPAPPAHTPPAHAPPNVELFVRTGPQNILASVNNSIQMEYDFINQDKLREEEMKKDQTDQVEALNRKKERIFRSASATSGVGASGVGGGDSALPPPALPAVGKVFDVYVAMAANPWNFVVQPNSTRHTLQAMMESLQKECPKLSESDAPVNPASGELYTVYYDKDSSWYRVTVAGTVSADTVSVYFCDYGDLALVAARALRPVPRAAPLARTLPPQAIKAKLFGKEGHLRHYGDLALVAARALRPVPRAAPLARTLPPQAIKAKLFDVWPLHQDWSVEDCIRFQELCVEQQFVGVCKEVGRDPLHPDEPLLTLDLIDTSTDEDVFLNRQLVAEGRARHAAAAPAAPAT